RNIDKSTTIRALMEDNKDKTVEIEGLKAEKERERMKNEAFVSMEEDIGDYIFKERPHLEPKVPDKFPSVMHYVHTLVELVLEDGPLRITSLKDAKQEAERKRASL
ncbi:hypothetical protein KI387_041912, partial [Taxus chinensis]